VHLAVLDVRDGQVHTIAATEVGSGVEVREASLAGNRIQLRLAPVGSPADASATTVTYRLSGERLVRDASP
jgi:hypothetical protein